VSDVPYSGYGGPGNFGPGGFDAGGFEGVPGMDPNIPSAPPPFSFSDPLAGTQPITAPPSGIGESLGEYAKAGTNTMSDGVPTPAPARPSYGPYADVAEVPTFDYGRAASGISEASADPNIFQQGYDAVKQGYDTVKQGYNAAVDTIESGIKSVIPEPIQDAYGATRDFVKDLIPPDYRDVLSTAKDVALVGGAATTAYSAYEMKKELDRQKDEADRIMRDKENRKQEEIAWAQGVLRDYPIKYERLTAEEVAKEQGMARGGIASLAKGGLPPRYLRGGGDGMSDSIPARIAGKQEARLADGEFVVPADVVSHLGNGSSNAGAKKLYAMMDRARKARTGKTSQAPEVNTRRLMPV